MRAGVKHFPLPTLENCLYLTQLSLSGLAQRRTHCESSHPENDTITGTHSVTG